MHASVQIPLTDVCDQHMSAICVCVCVCVCVCPVESGWVDFGYLVLFVLQFTSALKSVVVLWFSPKSFTRNRYQVACE